MPGVRKTRKGRRKGRKNREISLAESAVPESNSLPREQMYQVDPVLLVEVQAFNTGLEEELCDPLDAAEEAWRHARSCVD